MSAIEIVMIAIMGVCVVVSFFVIFDIKKNSEKKKHG